MKFLPGLIAACCLASGAGARHQEPDPDPAVFALLSPDGDITGSTFYVDEDLGLFLTAAHVLEKARYKKDELVTIKWEMTVALHGGFPHVLDVNVNAVVAAHGYEYWEGGKKGRGPDSEDDWAVLRIVDEADKELFEPFIPTPLDPFLTYKLTQSTKAGFAVGFPLGDVPRKEFNSRLTGIAGKRLMASGAVKEGYSGGAWISNAWKLIGIIVSRNNDNDSFHHVLPTYAFIWPMTKALTSSSRTDRIIDYLGTQRDDPERNRLKARMLVALRGLSPIEHWLLLNQICEADNLQTSPLVNFLFDYYSHNIDYLAMPFYDRLTECLSTDTMRATMQRVALIASTRWREEDAADLRPQADFAISLGASLLTWEDVTLLIEIAPQNEVADFMLNVAELAERYHPSEAINVLAARALVMAYRLAPDRVAGTAAFVAKNALTEDRRRWAYIDHRFRVTDDGEDVVVQSDDPFTLGMLFSLDPLLQNTDATYGFAKIGVPRYSDAGLAFLSIKSGGIDYKVSLSEAIRKLELGLASEPRYNYY